MAEGAIIALLIILVVVVVGIIIFVVIRGRRGDLDANCDPSGGTCDAGLVCDSATSTCRVPTGGFCATLADCATGAVECRALSGADPTCQNTASGMLGQSCSANVGPTSCVAGLTCDNAAANGSQTCRKPNGQSCTGNADCLTGSTCVSGVCGNTPAPLTRGFIAPPSTSSSAWAAPSGAIDLVQYGSSVFEVLPGGQVRNARTGRLHRSSVPVARMVVFDGYLHALANGRFYQLGGIDDDDWSWEHQEWAPDGLVFVSATHDGKTLWLQTRDEGFVVRRGSTSSPRREDVAPGTWRVYGNDERQWLDLSIGGAVDSQGRRYSAPPTATPYAGYALHDTDDRVVIARPPDRYLRLIEWEATGF